MGKAFRVDTRGVAEAIRKAKTVRNELISAIDKETDIASLNIVNNAKQNAPRKTGYLVNQIQVTEKKLMFRKVEGRAVYTARQEYEHASKKGFFRKALWDESERYRSAINQLLRKIGR